MQASGVVRRLPRLTADVCRCGAPLRQPLHRAGPIVLRKNARRLHISAAQQQATAAIASTSTAVPPLDKQPSMRFFRKSFLQAEPKLSEQPIASSSVPATAEERRVQPTDVSGVEHLPPIAVPSAAWRPLEVQTGLRSRLAIYKQLAKGRLSAWIVLTAMAGYAMCPTDPAAAALAMEALVNDTFGSAAIIASGLPEASTNTFRTTTLLATAIGTGLCSASANTFNQLIEIPYDAQMPRTAKRPLPSHRVSPLHAFTFGSVSGIAGTALLYACVNPLVASLGLLNVVLYAGVYTPLKRLSVVNTWVGAVVGGIPPLMGWAACTNSLDPLGGQAGAWVLALILFAWQFPHFNALSWTIRSEYARGGYRMLSAINPSMNGRVSLRWTIVGTVAAAVGAPLVGLTTWTVGALTLLPSGALTLYAWRFWRAGSRSSLLSAKKYGLSRLAPGARAGDRDPRDAPARSLFFVSLVHLPSLLFIMMASKLGFDQLSSTKEKPKDGILNDEQTIDSPSSDL